MSIKRAAANTNRHWSHQVAWGHTNSKVKKLWFHALPAQRQPHTSLLHRVLYSSRCSKERFTPADVGDQRASQGWPGEQSHQHHPEMETLLGPALGLFRTCILTPCLNMGRGHPWWLGGEESACQCRRPRRCGFDPWVQKIPWSRKWQPTPGFLPGESHGQRSLAG